MHGKIKGLLYPFPQDAFFLEHPLLDEKKSEGKIKRIILFMCKYLPRKDNAASPALIKCRQINLIIETKYSMNNELSM